MLLWYTFGPNLTTYRTFHILIEAQQFLSFLAPEKLSLLIFLNFLGFEDFEPQVSYKSFLIKKNKCTTRDPTTVPIPWLWNIGTLRLTQIGA